MAERRRHKKRIQVAQQPSPEGWGGAGGTEGAREVEKKAELERWAACVRAWRARGGGGGVGRGDLAGSAPGAAALQGSAFLARLRFPPPGPGLPGPPLAHPRAEAMQMQPRKQSQPAVEEDPPEPPPCVRPLCSVWQHRPREEPSPPVSWVWRVSAWRWMEPDVPSLASNLLLLPLQLH